MFKKVLKRAFTIVELVVVIAVIAALAAVLIPTFANVINSANESADQQAVRNMNTALIAEEKISGTPKSPEAAMQIIEEAGYNVENYIAQSSNNTLYYDWTENRVLIWTVNSNGTGSVTYPSDMAETYSSAKGVAANWYTLSDAYCTEPVDALGNVSSSSTTLVSAVTNATAGQTKILQLQSDLTVSSALSNSNGASITIDLNGYELTNTSSISTIIEEGSTVYLKNGTYTAEKMGTAKGALTAKAGSSITLENVELTTSGTGLFPYGDAAQVNVINSTIYTTGAYAVATNASTAYTCSINIENSTLQVAEGYCTICINVDATLTINNSTIIAGSYGMDQSTNGVMQAGSRGIAAQAILCRAGTVNINDSTVTLYTQTSTNDTVQWKADGNVAPFTAIVLGDATTGYTSSDAEITMSNCTVTVCDFSTGDILEGGKAIYMYGKDETGYKSVLTFDSSTKINGYVVVGGSQDVTVTSCPAKYECSVVTINGTSYSPTTNTDSTTTGRKYTVSGTTFTEVS